MSITALVCKVAVGVASLTIYPGVEQSPRYQGAEIRIEFDGGKLTDIRIDGPYDRDYSYAQHGVKLNATRLGDRWLLEARIDGKLDAEHEQMVITDSGQLLWVQVADDQRMHASSGSLFTGSCRAAR